MFEFLSHFWVSNLVNGSESLEKKLHEVSTKWIAYTRLPIINNKPKYKSFFKIISKPYINLYYLNKLNYFH